MYFHAPNPSFHLRIYVRNGDNDVFAQPLGATYIDKHSARDEVAIAVE